MEYSLKIQNLKKLKQAGVRIKVSQQHQHIFDIKFENGTLRIPTIIMNVTTEVVARNLIAFERCHGTNNYITDYFIVMNRLVDTEEDVELLIRYGILDTWLSDTKEIARAFNSTVQGCNFNPRKFYYKKLSKDLDHFCKTPCNKWKAILKRDYFNTPWAVISFFAAILLLMLTIAQTVGTFVK
ncbi:hypothetical protein HS088_TW04G00151 [Tripterygium wilfordii]|uniref:Uncharacterized protein n=1 Tax=Tripterygium wilfordii TaxID=458696 RepID=A0A7J7DP98_TRIWF|nr:hypothetical protein HS088_TW04G00151 [Tripterygium wilfordii]